MFYAPDRDVQVKTTFLLFLSIQSTWMILPPESCVQIKKIDGGTIFVHLCKELSVIYDTIRRVVSSSKFMCYFSRNCFGCN